MNFTGSNLSRREWMRIGGIPILGLGLSQLLARTHAAESSLAPGSVDDPTFGQAKNVIYLFLSGGPSQYETFDPKPEAPAEIRGTFQPISTNVPGINICELLPRTACIADKLAIVRSFATDDNNHESGGYWVHTGHKYVGPNMRALAPTDWPTLGSIVKMLRPANEGPFSSVMLPEPIVANPNVFLPGQNAGFLGPRWDPEIFRCDPAASNFKIDGFSLPDDVSGLRLSSRESLLAEFDAATRLAATSTVVSEYDRLQQDALSILVSGSARHAFALEEEPDELRDRYGRGKWGQSVLLARRLIEAGVRMVFVNWPREPGDLSANNPLWDTHAQNDVRMKDVLCPQFDLGFTALVEDLDTRGLLDETLVVAVGEMGRTPKFNGAGGRDHWGHVFNFVMAGAGIRTAQAYGASDRNGAYPLENRVQPQDLTATMLHLLGVGHEAFFPDKTGRPLRATEGEPITGIIGNSPATEARTVPGGSIQPIPRHSNDALVNLDFEEPALLDVSESTPGWRATPRHTFAKGDEFGVILAKVADVRSRSGTHHAAIGYGLATGNGAGKIPQGTRGILVQDIQNPRPGQFTFSIHSSGGAYDRPDYYRDVWCQNFTCRLVLFGYANANHDIHQIVEYASTTFEPPFAGSLSADYRKYSVSARLESQNGGSNQLSHGIGVAVIVEKTSHGTLDVPTGGPLSQGLIRLDDAELVFEA
ncbi:MAG: DUF1501 domain-containing protein [Planctomycetota bacterium]|nr:DUF1501 domain-containing protein [Planctomycetota bacterium]